MDEFESGIALNITSQTPKRQSKKRRRQDLKTQPTKKPKPVVKKNGSTRSYRKKFQPNKNAPKTSKPRHDIGWTNNRKEAPPSKDSFVKKSFSSLPLDARLTNQLETHMKMTGLTHIQALAIPALLSGRDVLFRSQTGSGKTLAFLVPIIQKLQETPIQRSDGTRALILTPTRELSIQIFTVLKSLLTAYHWIVPGIVMGGERKKSEKQRLRKGCTILLATPGRLLDHLDTTSSFKIDKLEWMVFDEADRLLDMGFEEEVRRIVSALEERHTGPKKRQTVLVSATLDKAVDRLAKFSLSDPLFVGDGTSDGKVDDTTSDFKIPERLEQHYLKVSSQSRLVGLAALLKWIHDSSAEDTKSMVFLSTCNEVEFFYELFSKATWDGVNAMDQRNDGDDDDDGSPLLDCALFQLHGNINQQERTKTYFDFCKCDSGILFCTDVGARGLDLPCVDWIIQYDPPEETVEYVHRVGRTARLGRSGSAVLFLLPAEVGYLNVLREISAEPKPINYSEIIRILDRKDELDSKHSKKRPRKKNYGFWTQRQAGSALQSHFENLVESDLELSDLARRGFQSYIRSYATYPRSMKPIFHVKNLHLGHVARNFALKEDPSKVRKYFTESEDLTAQSKKHKFERSAKKHQLQKGFGKKIKSQNHKKERHVSMSEFAA